MKPTPDAAHTSGNFTRAAARIRTWAAVALTALVLQNLGGLVSRSAIAGGKVETGLEAGSPVLGRKIAYSLYTPDPSLAGAGPLPVLYLLHGKGDDEKAWIDKGGITGILDRNIATGRVRPMIVVMPAAGNSWYVDDALPSRYGAVEKAFTTDLVGVIEARYRVLRCRSGRAVGGLSMGGYGAILYALDRPDLFGAAFSLSGSLFSERAADIERRRSAYERIYQGVFGEPFDAGKFLAANVFVKLGRPRKSGDELGVWLAAGNRDFPSILDGSVRMHEELQLRGIASELHVMEGGHTWELWNTAVEPALHWLSRRQATTCAKS